MLVNRPGFEADSQLWVWSHFPLQDVGYSGKWGVGKCLHDGNLFLLDWQPPTMEGPLSNRVSTACDALRWAVVFFPAGQITHPQSQSTGCSLHLDHTLLSPLSSPPPLSTQRSPAAQEPSLPGVLLLRLWALPLRQWAGVVCVVCVTIREWPWTPGGAVLWTQPGILKAGLSNEHVRRSWRCEALKTAVVLSFLKRPREGSLICGKQDGRGWGWGAATRPFWKTSVKMRGAALLSGPAREPGNKLYVYKRSRGFDLWFKIKAVEQSNRLFLMLKTETKTKSLYKKIVSRRGKQASGAGGFQFHNNRVECPVEFP